jgi:hypothetical protein
MSSGRWMRLKGPEEPAVLGHQPPKPMLHVIFILSALILLVSYDSAES